MAAEGVPAGQTGDYITAAEHATGTKEKTRSLWSDAWHDLTRRPLFVISMAVIAFLVVVAIFPSWFAEENPRLRDLDRARIGPNVPYLATVLAIIGSGITVIAAILATVGKLRDGVSRKMAPYVAGIGGVLLLAGGLINSVTLYLVIGALVFACGVVSGVPKVSRLLRGNAGTWGVVALLAVAGGAGLFIALDDLSTVEVGAAFGYDQQGRDIYARVVYGTRYTLLVGFSATLLTVLIGSLIGILSGYFGGWLDSLLSRIGEVFFGLPFVLGAIVILSAFRSAGFDSAPAIVAMVVMSISVLSWPVSMRIMRSAVIAAKQQDYVKAARALGASSARIIFRHLLPNCLAPVLVYATIALGAFIGAEATLSFLGIGLRDPAVSWGVMIADSRDYIRASPLLLIFPASFLTLTVLVFVTIGDAVREALDPKLK
jgi:oligopeptide transport system permease protein